MWGVGFIGLGGMGRNMLDTMRQHGQFTPVIGFDPGVVNGLDIPIVSSIREVCEHPDVQVVYIASPPRFHAEAVYACLRAGKAVFCEKPLAHDLTEAATLARAVEDAGVRQAVNFPFATHLASRHLQHLVSSGVLGEIREARLHLRFASWPRPWQQGAASWLTGAQDGGYLREVGSHFLFLAQRILGPGEVVSSLLTRTAAGCEDTVQARIRFGDVMLTVDGAIAGDIDDDNALTFVGTQATASLRNWGECHFGNDVIESDDWHAGQLDALDLLLAGQPTPLATFAEAAHVASLVETILKG